MANETKLGVLIGPNAKRDAVHVAVAPVVAGDELAPGQHVGFMEPNDGKTVGASKKPLGIVDPFLKTNVNKGEHFWMFLYPNAITSLQHEWVHPAFSKEEAATSALQESIEWVTTYARLHCPYDESDAYNRFMERVRDGDIFYHGTDCHGISDVDDADELFRHLSVILGMKVGPGNFEYSCSC